MNFNFSNTSAFGATSTPAKPPPAFGAVQPQSTGAFGGTSAFGATGFGTQPTATSAAPAFGFNSAPPTSSTNAFGFSNTPQTASSGLGGFGATQAPSTGFGLSGGSTTFGGFGASTTTQPTSAAPAFSGFGTGIGFNANTPATSSAFSFNPSGFGAQASAAPTNFGGFSSTFGKPAASNFSAFGQTQPQQFMLGQQQQQPPPQLNPDEAFAQSIFNVSIYGDERDTVIAKWNYLQAMWGSGKTFYTKNAPPVDITPQNYLCRFKAIGYNKMPGKENKMGLVSLVVNKSEADVKNQKEQLIAQLNQVFGNKPNIMINVDSIEPLTDTKCQVVIYVQEKSQISNEIKRITSTEVSNFLIQPMTKNQCTNMGIEDIIALISPDDDQLKEYLEKTPKGIDPRMWNQAKQDNPDPKKFIPVPIIGFNELKRRIKCQEKETEMHSLYLAKVQKDLEELKQKHIDATAKILGYKRKLADLCHIILHIIVKQEITRKVGVALSPEEEVLRSKLENMQALVSAPTQYKGRLSELLSQMRMQRNQWSTANTVDYALDPDSAEEMKTFLSMQQKAMSFLIETANKDMETLKNIYEKMGEIVRD